MDKVIQMLQEIGYGNGNRDEDFKAECLSAVEVLRTAERAAGYYHQPQLNDRWAYTGAVRIKGACLELGMKGYPPNIVVDEMVKELQAG